MAELTLPRWKERCESDGVDTADESLLVREYGCNEGSGSVGEVDGRD